MRRYRFLLTPRWIGLILGVTLLVPAFSLLAEWQFGRNDQVSAENARIRAGMEAPARQVGEVLSRNQPVGADEEWHKITARGRYDADRQILVRYRHFDGEPGYEVLTPLRTPDGTALLVNRGWIPTGASAVEAPDPPAPPAGEVTVTGRVRAAEHGDPPEIRPDDGEVRFIVPETIDRALPYPAYRGFVELTDQQPAPGATPRLLPEPDLDAGPHLSYGVQWYLFAAIAVIGLGVLAYDEAHDGKLKERWSAQRARREDDDECRAASALPKPD